MGRVPPPTKVWRHPPRYNPCQERVTRFTSLPKSVSNNTRRLLQRNRNKGGEKLKEASKEEQTAQVHFILANLSCCNFFAAGRASPRERGEGERGLESGEEEVRTKLRQVDNYSTSRKLYRAAGG